MEGSAECVKSGIYMVPNSIQKKETTKKNIVFSTFCFCKVTFYYSELIFKVDFHEKKCIFIIFDILSLYLRGLIHFLK